MKITLVLAAALLAASACQKQDAPSSSASTQPASAEQPASASQPGTHVIAVTVDGNGFTPGGLTVDEGQKTVLRFTRTTDATCAKKVVFPSLHLEKDLPLNTPVDVSIPTDSAREIAFQCGMGMLKSALVVR